MNRTKLKIIAAALIVCIMSAGLVGCNNQIESPDLMSDVSPNPVSGKDIDKDFVDYQMELAIELFRSSVLESKDKNVLVSPLSIQLALAMTANGAVGATRDEMESLLCGDLGLETLNEYLYTYVNSLPSGEKYKLNIANSIWFRDEEDRLTVNESFLQKNADYYGAQIYRSAFDNQTLKDINNWIDINTDGMIDKIIDEISADTVMYLINALAFDAEWENVYNKENIYNGTFNSLSGEQRNVEVMHSEESRYLNDGKATGFIKNYKDGKYSFVALLPNEDVDLYSYIAGLTAEGILNTLSNAQNGEVVATMPKFSYEYELSMNNVLKGLGMPTAFDPDNADFTDMAISSNGNIYIGDVLHKTFISVDELGTKAGAVTKVEMKDEAAPMYRWTVKLDRPFVYMIIDNSTNLPIFIGTVTDIQ